MKQESSFCEQKEAKKLYSFAPDSSVGQGANSSTSIPATSVSEQRRFSLSKRVSSFIYAGRGIAVFLRTTHNAWVQLLILAIAIALAWHLQITRTEWMMLVLASGLVLCAEAFNTAIEIDIDLTSPTHNPLARDTKDVAAGAVLIAAMTAAAIGAIIFLPYLLV